LCGCEHGGLTTTILVVLAQSNEIR
jgi:hypothetical protein